MTIKLSKYIFKLVHFLLLKYWLMIQIAVSSEKTFWNESLQLLVVPRVFLSIDQHHGCDETQFEKMLLFTVYL